MKFEGWTITEIAGAGLVHLQCYGGAVGKPAENFRPGEFMKWNGGSTSEFLEILRETKSQIVIKEKCIDRHGVETVYERRLKKSRLVAIGTRLES